MEDEIRCRICDCVLSPDLAICDSCGSEVEDSSSDAFRCDWCGTEISEKEYEEGEEEYFVQGLQVCEDQAAAPAAGGINEIVGGSVMA